jgi:hypothetical protein
LALVTPFSYTTIAPFAASQDVLFPLASLSFLLSLLQTFSLLFVPHLIYKIGATYFMGHVPRSSHIGDPRAHHTVFIQSSSAHWRSAFTISEIACATMFSRRIQLYL